MITKDELINQIMPWLPPVAAPPSACIDAWAPLKLRGYGQYSGGRHDVTDRWVLDATNCAPDGEAMLRPGDLLVWLGEVTGYDSVAVFAPARVLAVEVRHDGRERVWTLHDRAAGGQLADGCSALSDLPGPLLKAVRTGPRVMSPEDGAATRQHFGQLDRCLQCGGHAQSIAYGLQLPPVTQVIDPVELEPQDLGEDKTVGGCDVSDDNPAWKCMRCNAIG